MDIFGGTMTVVHEVWAVAMFIKEIVDDVRSYDRDKKDIQARLAHEFLFFEDFKTMFFDDGPGQEFYKTRPLAFQKDCDNILKKFQEILGEYEAKATKYGLVDLEEGLEPGSVEDGKVVLKDRWLSKFRKKMVGQLKDLKTKAIDWSIFDKSAIFNMLENFSDWTARLRETVIWMLGTREFKDRFSPDPNTLRKMQLQDALIRQENSAISDPPGDFGPLIGFVKEFGDGNSHSGEPIMAKFSEVDNGWEDAQDVVIETRKYDTSGNGDDAEENSNQIKEYKQAIRRLAYLLFKSSFSKGPDLDASNGPPLLSFNFKGYIEFPDQSKVIFIYDPPATTTLNMETLYSIINKKSLTPLTTDLKPSLGNRYYLAHTLAVTVLNIHSSRWVHKNIWSKGIMLCASPNTKWQLRMERLVPYLCGWEIARPDCASTAKLANYDLLANLYRHPRRQGQPTTKFKSEHDMYALGVVLIEIGLWQTVDQIFSAELANGRVGPNRLSKWWVSTGSRQVMGEMGEAYSEVISRCLEAKKEIVGNGEERFTGLIAFRDNVTDVLSIGLDL